MIWKHRHTVQQIHSGQETAHGGQRTQALKKKQTFNHSKVTAEQNKKHEQKLEQINWDVFRQFNCYLQADATTQ